MHSIENGQRKRDDTMVFIAYIEGFDFIEKHHATFNLLAFRGSELLNSVATLVKHVLAENCTKDLK